MAETEKTPESNSGGAPLTIGDLRKMITETVQGLVGGNGEKKDDNTPPKDEPTHPQAGGIAAEVQRQVEKIRAREARQKRDEEVDGKLKELSEKVQEKQPVERRRVHKIMGWGE